MKLILPLLLLLVNFPVHAAPQPGPAPAPKPVPASMLKNQCEILLTWMKSAAPVPTDARDITEVIQELSDKEDAQINSTLARRAYVEGNQIFEGLLSSLAAGDNATKILPTIRRYVIPAAVQAKKVAGIARDIHKMSAKDQTDYPDQYKALIQSYETESHAFGRLFSRYVMIMETLVSVASGRGILDVGTVKQNPNPADKTIVDGATLVFALTNPGAIETARKLLEYLDRDIAARGLPLVPATTSNNPEDTIPYPSLQVVQTLFRNNLYARLANREWSLEQQDYSSKPWVWVTHLISDAAVNTTGNLPQWLRPLARTLSGLGNVDSVSARYLGSILDAVSVSRFADDKGNMIVTKSNYYVRLQLKRLFDNSAKGPNDDELTTLARIMWLSDDVWPAMVDQLATQAGIKVDSGLKPASKDDAAAKDDSAADDGSANDNTSGDDKGGDDTAKKAASDSDDALAADTTATKPVPKAKPSKYAKGVKVSKKAQQQLDDAAKKGDPGPRATQSQLAAFWLARMLKAEKAAQDLGPIPFTSPQMTGLILRFALVQTVEWGVFTYGVAHWSDLLTSLGNLGPWIMHFIP